MLKFSEESKQNDMFKKLWTILICLLLLLIPLQFAKGIIQERYGYKLEAQDAISKAWAKAQNINPPQLTTTTEYDDEYEIPLKDYNVKVNITTEIRKKGIFKIPVYTAEVEQNGTFISAQPLPAKNQNTIKMTVTDAKGYISTPLTKLGNAKEFTRYGDPNIAHSNFAGLKEIPFVIKYKLSMCIFYLLLLSISEFISFKAAYFIATAMTISLISMYTTNVLARGKNRKFTLILTGIITFLYLFLYILLILKDYSLIVGSIGTFIIISAVMYATRDLEWYKDKNENTSE